MNETLSSEKKQRIEAMMSLMNALKKDQSADLVVTDGKLPGLLLDCENADADLRKASLERLKDICRSNDPHRRKVVEAGGLPVLLRLMDEQWDEDTQSSAVTIFRLISDTELFQEEMIAVGAPVVLLRLVLRTPPSRARKRAIQALSDISESYFVRHHVVRALEEVGTTHEKVSDLLRSKPFDQEEKDAWIELTRNCEIAPHLYVEDGIPWYNPYEERFLPFVKLLEDNWKDIRDEAAHLQEELMIAWPEKYLCERGWDVLGFYAFENKIEEICKTCPKTTAVLEQIPGLVTAIYSRLKPRSHIKPHVGYYVYSEKILRIHLGLFVPKGCTLQVNGIGRQWEEGKVMIFDDTYRHEAWNPDPSRERIVLMLDIKIDVPIDDRNPEFVATSNRQKAIMGEEALVTSDLIAALDKVGTKPQDRKSVV